MWTQVSEAETLNSSPPLRKTMDQNWYPTVLGDYFSFNSQREVSRNCRWHRV